MEILFSVLLLIVPIISIAAMFLSLLNARKLNALQGMTKTLIATLRGGERNPLDEALDDLRML